MIHEGMRIADEIKRLQKELERPISNKRRQEIQQAIRQLETKKSAWERPH